VQAVGEPSDRALGFPPPGRKSTVDDGVTVLLAEGRARSAEPVPLTADKLCEAYAGRVFKFAQLVSEDSESAEDLAQDALERAIKRLNTFDPSRGAVEGWLWRIVVNAGRDAGRIARRQRLLVQVLVDRWVPTAGAIHEPGELTREELIDAVRTLSPRHRALIALRFGADLTYGDVGRALGISEAAALMAIRRALAILRLRLSQRMRTDD
jgi:RNA polymerase sigma-70 factor, ECF subfamily